MSNNASKGTYYRARTKKWLEDLGYTVALLERMHMIAPGRFVKRDQLGSDLLAVKSGSYGVLFVQVKGGITGKSNVSAGRREFEKFPCPVGTRQVVVLWEPGSRRPRLWFRAAGIDGWEEGQLL